MTNKRVAIRAAVLAVSLLVLMGTVEGPHKAVAGPVLATTKSKSEPSDQDVNFPDEFSIFTELAGNGHIPAEETLRSFAIAQQTSSAGNPLAVMKAGVAWQFLGENYRAFADYAQVAAAYPDSDVAYQRLANVAPEGIWVYVHGRPVQFSDAQPMIQSGRTLVPVRAVSEALGADVEWNAETSTATFRLNGRTIALSQDNRFAIVDSNPVAMDVPAIEVPPGRLMLPLRFVSEALGQKVTWHCIVPAHNVIAIR